MEARDAAMTDVAVGSRGRRLRRLVLLLLTLVVGAMIGGFALQARGERGAALEAADRELMDLAGLLSEHAGRLLDAVDFAMAEAGLVAAGASWDELQSSFAAHRRLVQLEERLDYVAAFWLTDEHGMPRVTNRAFPAPAIDTSDREYFRPLMISPLIESRYTRERNVVVARRLAGPDGSFRGIVQAVIDPDYFYGFYERLAARPGTAIFLVRQDGAVIVRYPTIADPPDDWSIPQLAAAVRAGVPAIIDFESPVDRVVRRAGVTAVSRYPAAAAIGRTPGAILAPWRRTVRSQVVYLAVALLATLGLGGLLLEGIRRSEQAAADLEVRVADRTRELQAVLESRNMLLREVNHRIKNNLQIVSSLLGLHGRRAQDPQVRQHLEEAQARIGTIAALHARLYRNDRYDSVDLGDYLAHLCDDVLVALGGDPAARRIVLETEPVMVSIDQAVPIALIVNELVTNAFQHAFAPDEPGTVMVRLHATDGRLDLEIRDGGRGLPGAEHRRAGMGSALVEGFVRQLGGSIAVIDAMPGTSWQISVPLTALERAA
jgi:two-component sensor histidine kinase